ncbi:hypothetical protein ACWGDE_01130 [Streptomyces sp. NPDC054956]
MTEQNTTGTAPAAPEDAAAQPAAATDALAVPAPEPTVPAQAPAPAAETPAAETTVAETTVAEAQDAVPAEAVRSNPFAAPEVPAAPKDRRKLFAALRWTAAVLVFAAVGTGVAYGITQPERTDIPGLSTKDDGRWVYPALSKPALPPGAALPFAKDNKDGIHYAGLTQLLLPPPTGSTPDSTLKLEKDEVVTTDTFLAEYEDVEREKMKERFGNEGLRQIVGRGWTTPDGTRTRIYLLRFHASGFADTFKGCNTSMQLKGTRTIADVDWTKAKGAQSVPSLSDVSVYTETAPFGDEQAKVGCIRSGDVVGIILQTRKGEVATVPFHQTVILQHQLLG